MTDLIIGLSLHQSPRQTGFVSRGIMSVTSKMRRLLVEFCLLGSLWLTGAAIATGFAQQGSGLTPQESAARRYVIGSGDVLQITVAGEPDASMPTAVVRPDGLISIPLVKEIKVAGLTPKELERLITTQLSVLIRDPDVSVYVKEIHSEKVYVIGAVRREGSINVDRPLTVLQTIGEAGGLTDYAKRNKIYVLRQEGGKQTRFPFDYNAVIRSQHPEQNIVLSPGDTVVVP